jgi:hypothetical protein
LRDLFKSPSTRISGSNRLAGIENNVFNFGLIDNTTDSPNTIASGSSARRNGVLWTEAAGKIKKNSQNEVNPTLE